MPEKENDDALQARNELRLAVENFYMATGVRVTDMSVGWIVALGTSRIESIEIRGKLT